MHISLRVNIPNYRSPYSGARVAQTSGGEALVGMQLEECLNLIKGTLAPSISLEFYS
jgi:hypothetical protein